MAVGYWILIGIGAFLALVLLYDFIQRKKPVLSNFPLIGHIRYFLITIGPELRQYIVATNREERPFTRSQRQWIEEAGDGKENYFSFGTDDSIYKGGYTFIKNTAVSYGDPNFIREGVYQDTTIPCAKTFGEYHKRKMPFQAQSLINISGMSYGALGGRAVAALNKGAKQAGCYQSTGEGGLSQYHRHGADVMFQIGTGNFGVQGPDGKFSMDRLARLCEENPFIKLIEIKLSQGAKPGKGGLLPGKKVTAEIAKIRGVPVGKDCLSPTKHTTFSTPEELVEHAEKIAEATGRPVGIKAAIGHTGFYEKLAEEMKRSGRGIDFITIDGGEGGTGAAPLAMTDHVSLPFRMAFTKLYKVFLNAGLAERVIFIGSGRLGFPDEATLAFAMGCDIIQVAREALIGIGCIQSQK